jgi:hypothetical protein|tara:strand:- start:869 stop:1252 length:384 start_codon:yes stop_codon:yes gene_type:complete
MARERKPYFIPLAWASVAAGASADLTTAVRNATGRPFVITELGFNSTIDATTSTYAIFDLVFSTTTEEAFMPSAFRVNSVASMANNPKLELAIPYVLGAGIEITGTATNNEANANSLYVTLVGYLDN